MVMRKKGPEGKVPKGPTEFANGRKPPSAPERAGWEPGAKADWDCSDGEMIRKPKGNICSSVANTAAEFLRNNDIRMQNKTVRDEKGTEHVVPTANAPVDYGESYCSEEGTFDELIREYGEQKRQTPLFQGPVMVGGHKIKYVGSNDPDKVQFDISCGDGEPGQKEVPLIVDESPHIKVEDDGRSIAVVNVNVPAFPTSIEVEGAGMPKEINTELTFSRPFLLRETKKNQ